MANAITISSVEASGQILSISGNITLSGSYVTGGETLDFTKATADVTFSGLLPQIEAIGGPVQLAIWSQGGLLTAQYSAILGTTLSNSKLKVGAIATFGTEHAAAAYEAAITGDKITFTLVIFKL